MRNRGVVQQWITLQVASRDQPQFAFVVFQKNVAALGPRQPQGDIEHGHQNFVEHSRGVQLARRLEKQTEFFEIGSFRGDLYAGKLAQEFAGSIGSGVRGIKKNVGGITRPEFQAVIALEFLALDPLSVDERAMLASLIDQVEVVAFQHNLRVVAGDARVGNDEVLINLASHVERRTVQHDIFLIVALDKHQRGKHTGTRTVVTDGTQGHEMSD